MKYAHHKQNVSFYLKRTLTGGICYGLVTSRVGAQFCRNGLPCIAYSSENCTQGFYILQAQAKYPRNFPMPDVRRQDFFFNLP